MAEIVPVFVPGRGTGTQVTEDEQPGNAKPETLPMLPPAFASSGTITAATLASILDGAAALELARSSTAEKMGPSQEARIIASTAHAHAPALFTTAPVFAIRKLLARVNWNVDNVDLFEVN